MTSFTPAVLMMSLSFSLAGATPASSVPAAAPAGPQRAVAGPGFPQFPSLSPDGTVVVFAAAGDLWASPISGGVAERLTSHPADEGRSAFSPDGKWLAFESDRDGATNLYVSALASQGPGSGGGAASGGLVAGEARRITVSDRAQSLGGWTMDGSGVLFAGGQSPTLHRPPRMYFAPLDGGPTRLLGGMHGSKPRAIRAADGRLKILFSRGGGSGTIDYRPAYRGSGQVEIWIADLPAPGTEGSPSFTRVTNDPAHDGEPFGLPDGSIAFLSARDGQYNVFWMGAPGQAAGQVRQLTSFKPSERDVTIGHGVRDLAVSADGRMAAFVVWDTLYRLDLTKKDGKPEEIRVSLGADGADGPTRRLNLDREVSEAALSPDGKTLAVVARGEVFVRSVDEGRPTRRVTFTPGRERHLAWSPEGKCLYFTSDSGGDWSIYAAEVALTRDELVGAESEADALEKKKDEKKPEVAAPPKGATGTDAQATPAPTTPPTPPTPQADPNAAAAQPAGEPGDKKPDEKKTDDKKPAEKKPEWGKRWERSLRFTVRAVVDTPAQEQRPVPSPDGQKLLFTRGQGDLVLRDLASGTDRVVVEGFDAPEVAWAADSRHVVYANEDFDFNSDVWLLDTGGADGKAGGAGEAVNLTQHPDYDSSPRLSADGKVLVFVSDRDGENGQNDVYAIYLDRSLEGKRPYELDEYFKKAAEAAKKRKPLGEDSKEGKGKGDDAKGGGGGGGKGAGGGGGGDDAKAKEDGEAKEKDKPDEPTPPKAPKPLNFDTQDAHLRVRRLTSTLESEGNLALAPGGERVVYSVGIDDKPSLVSIDFKGGDRKTIDSAGVSDVSLSLTGDKVVYVKSGVANTAPPSGGKVETLAISAPVVIDLAAQNRQKFLEAARVIGEGFYHPTLKGLNWKGLTGRYLSLAERARTSDEFNRVGNMLFGELNGSHLGMSGGSATGGVTVPPPGVGYLGIDAEPGEGGYVVKRVLVGGPADRATSRLMAADVILSVDGEPLAIDGPTPMRDLLAAFAGKSGQETLLQVRRAGAETPVFVLIVPHGAGGEGDLRYLNTVRTRRDMVEKLSNGTLGYLHIRGMSEPSVRDFERDLYAAAHDKRGLIIDVRDNGGGSTADILLSSLTAPRHAFTIPRGGSPEPPPNANVPTDAYPRDRRLIYGYTRPINVLINENSFSNAEIFAHAIKTIGRGKLIGAATYGGVISTGGASLIDGTNVRLPFRGWYLPDGRDMENNGAQPDVPVEQTPADEAAGKDPQLEAAVKELLGRV